MHATKPRTRWTLAIVSLALFMVVLDNLIVTVALPSIQKDLGASLQQLEWTVNAYTLAFAVTLIPGAAIGDRFGRKRTFLAGLALFTASSAAAALAPGAAELVAARAAQGIGGAIVAPLTLTLLAEAFPPERRGAALGIWSGISGMGVALGPLVGGAVVDGLSWQWIFWINVPLGVALLPLAAGFLNESRGTATRLDLPGVALVTTGLFGLVYGLVRGQGEGWGSPVIVTSLVAGVLLVDAGVRMLVWTGATAITSPIAGVLAERRGPRALMAAGLALQAGALAWLAMSAGVDSTNSELAPAFAIAGIGMGLVFAPSASALLSVVAPQRAGQASGTNNAVREVGGVFGVAVMSTIFAHAGSFASPQAFVDGFTPALWVGAAVVGAGALVALLLPARRAADQHAAEAVEAAAAAAAAQPAAA